MRITFAETFSDGWRQFTGGYWLAIVTRDGQTTVVRPDGSLCEPRPATKRERAAITRGLNANATFRTQLEEIGL